MTKMRIPVIDLSKCSMETDRGTEEWKQLCMRVREACENYGCFEVVYDKIPMQLRAEIFSMIRDLFDLPVETKRKNFSSKNYHGYNGGMPELPLFESLGIEDASNYDSLKRFAELMWPPDGHQSFCHASSTLMKPLEELHCKIARLILDSYGLGGSNSDSFMECKTLFRLMKYKAPPLDGEYSVQGVGPHTDKTLCTLLCENLVSGLEIQTKNGQWIKVAPSPNSFIFMVGDLLMAWSNGRLHPPVHRVMISGREDRYSFGAFPLPLDGAVIRAREELVDDDHPRLLKDFGYIDYMHFSLSEEGLATESDKQVFAFAGN